MSNSGAKEESNVLVLVDVETTNLTPAKGMLLEVGLRVVDLNFNEIARRSHVIKYSEASLYAERGVCPAVVRDMHDANGLWHECLDEGMPLMEAEDEFLSWVRQTDIAGEPLTGSSHRLDREFLEAYMPELHAQFHYRSIDFSTVKELCRRYNPALFAKRPQGDTDHRVNTCLDGTVLEGRFYTENFLF